MISLWIGLLLLTLLALLLVLLPLQGLGKQALPAVSSRKAENIRIYKERLAELNAEARAGNLSEQDLSKLTRELQHSLLSDADGEVMPAVRVRFGRSQKSILALIVVLLPVAAGGLYYQYGSAQALQLSLEGPTSPFADGRMPSVEEAIALLNEQLAQQPDNPEGWYVLATTYMNQGVFRKGAESFAKTLQYLPATAPQYAAVMGQYAQALYFANNGQIDSAVRQQIERTLDIDPQEVTALGLLGIDAFEQQRYRQAIELWEKALVNASPQIKPTLQQGIQQARAALSEAVTGDAGDTGDAGAGDAVAVPIELQLDPALRDRVAPTDPVFIFARSTNAPMPIAAIKLTVADLPARVTLDDSHLLVPGQSLADFSLLLVGARVARSGQPGAQPGDIQAPAVRVTVGPESEPLRLVMGQIVE